MPTLAMDGHTIYYEVHGEPGAPKAVCMGGWGTFCHGRTGDAPRYLLDNYQVLVFDYRGIGESTDDHSQSASIKLYAMDLASLFDHLGWRDVHIVGMVGIGACIGQQLAFIRPDLARSLVMTGCWAWADPIMVDQLMTMIDVHEKMGWLEFQKLAATYSFDGEFYNANRSRLLGLNGAWPDLNGRLVAHRRLVEACASYDARHELPSIATPAVVVHAGRDPVTTPRHTGLIEELMPNCRGIDFPEATHVLAGKAMRMRFDAVLREFLESN